MDTERCKGCGLCVAACPKDVIEVDPRRVNHFGLPFARAAREDECIGCASCGIVCPDACITVYKKKL